MEGAGCRPDERAGGHVMAGGVETLAMGTRQVKGRPPSSLPPGSIYDQSHFFPRAYPHTKEQIALPTTAKGTGSKLSRGECRRWGGVGGGGRSEKLESP